MDPYQLGAVKPWKFVMPLHGFTMVTLGHFPENPAHGAVRNSDARRGSHDVLLRFYNLWWRRCQSQNAGFDTPSYMNPKTLANTF